MWKASGTTKHINRVVHRSINNKRKLVNLVLEFIDENKLGNRACGKSQERLGKSNFYVKG